MAALSRGGRPSRTRGATTLMDNSYETPHPVHRPGIDAATMSASRSSTPEVPANATKWRMTSSSSFHGSLSFRGRSLWRIVHVTEKDDVESPHKSLS